jgi:putative addiction module killer protein
MFQLSETEIFAAWLSALRDVSGRQAILKRLVRLQATGNFGDWASVGDEVSEMRIHIGPGYRLYYTIRGQEIIILLCGGDKKSQRRDIVKAKEIAAQL